jgi:hypothetical protein
MTSLESLCVACAALSLLWLVYDLPTLSALPMPSYLEWNVVSAIAPESFAGLSALQGLYVLCGRLHRRFHMASQYNVTLHVCADT